VNRARDDPASARYARVSDSSEVGPPHAIGPYEVREELGRGCMGVVYRVRRPADGKNFALKVVLGKPNEEALARFAREAQVGIRLRHPGIVPVVDLGQAGGRLYLVMEFCPGETLKQKLRSGGAMPAAIAADLGAQLADALGTAHEQGVLHRDLKPANIIIDQRTGIPRITDFGLARDNRDNRALTLSGQAVGTPSHMAPEQIRGQKIDPRAEVWALGVLLYECISGQLPFPAETYTEVGRQILHDEPPSPGGDDPELAAYVLDMLSKNPDHRPENMRAVAKRLRELAAPEPLAPPSSEAGVPVVVLAGIAVLGVVLLLGLLVGLLLWEPDAVSAADVTPEEPSVEVDSPAPELDPRAEELLAEAEQLAAERAVADRVLPLYDEAEPLVAGHPELERRLQLGRLQLLYRRGRYPEALELAEALIKTKDPARMYPALRFKGWTLLRLDKRRKAMQPWQELAQLDRDGVAGLDAASVVAFFGGDIIKGVECNQLARDREDPLARKSFLYYSAAYGAMSQGDTQQAHTYLDQAERLGPDCPETALIRAMVYQKTRDWTNARAAIERALELTAPRGFAQGLNVLVGVALNQRDNAVALEACERLADDFGQGQALFRCAQIRWQLNRRKRARKDLERLRDDFPEVWRQLRGNQKVQRWTNHVLGAGQPQPVKPGEPLEEPPEQPPVDDPPR